MSPEGARLWKETVTIEEPATEQQQQIDDVWAAWEKEQRRAHEMSMAAALDNKLRFAYVEQQPSTEPISRVSSNNTSDESPPRPTTMTMIAMACLHSSAVSSTAECAPHNT